MQTNRLHPLLLAVTILAVPIAARADLTGTVTLAVGTAFSFDTGATSSSGGDILFSTTGIAFQSSATGLNMGNVGSAGYGTFTATAVQALLMAETAPSIPASDLVVGDVFIVESIGGHAAKALVTASSGSSLSFQYDTFGVSTTTPSGPTITGVTNNYSYIPSGFPNSGIAPSSIFVIFGTGMANAPTGTVTLQSSASPGLPTSLSGATLSVTVNGTTVTPAMYYAIPTAIAAVLPANTPTGSATLTVTYNGTASNAFPIQVVSSAMGLDTYFGTGSGLVTATSPTTGALYNYTNSAAPGETVVLWGSGLGADTADSDTVFTSSPHSVNVPLQIYFGGVPGKVLYAGSSGYPGLVQINVTIPATVSTGCNISVVAVTGTTPSTVSSNFGTLAINTNGGECSDSIYGSTGGQLGNLSGQSTVREGLLFVAAYTSPNSSGIAETADIASGDFTSVSGASLGASSSSISLGSCTVNLTVSTTTPIQVTGLNAGTITLAGPAGNYTMQSLTTGTYFSTLPSGAISTSGGTFTFTGAGGSDVGSFTAAVTFPNPILSWTNQPEVATVTRSQGIGITWTGGAAGSLVAIEGSSTGGGQTGSFYCLVSQNPLEFTIPAYITSTLPAGTGTLSVENLSSYSSFTASNLDYGLAFGFTGTSVNTTYQ
jgi:uncharacterized protein (TIGR03437 family)